MSRALLSVLLASAAPAAALQPSASPRAPVVEGVVTDRATGLPLEGVTVTSGDARTTTGAGGRYRLQLETDSTGPVAIEFRRLGYDGVRATVVVTSLDAVHAVDVALPPAATRLPDIIAETTSAILARHGFYVRQNAGVGQFLTADDIEAMNAPDVESVLRRVPGVRVGAVQDVGVMTREAQIRSSVVLGGCNAFFTIDGVITRRPVLQSIPVESIAGIEVYARATTVPAEFANQMGTAEDPIPRACGVIAIWTRPPAPSRASSTELRVAPVAGLSFHPSPVGESRYGARLLAVRRVLEFGIGFNALTDVPDKDPRQRLTGWEFLFNARGRLLGSTSPWFVGGGLAVIKANRGTDDPLGRITGAGKIESNYDLITGISFPNLTFSPTVEVHAIGIHRGGDAEVLVLVALDWWVNRQ